MELRSTSMRPLKPRERAFIEAFTTGPTALNATESARVAGYQAPEKAGRYSLHRERIRREVDLRIAKRIPGPEESLGEVAEIAMAPWRDFVSVRMDDEGNVVSTRMDLASKMRGLEVLAKYHGLTASPVERELAALLHSELRRLRTLHGRRAAAKIERGAPRPRLKSETAIIIDVEAQVELPPAPSPPLETASHPTDTQLAIDLQPAQASPARPPRRPLG
jgi:hypothetical protein